MFSTCTWKCRFLALTAAAFLLTAVVALAEKGGKGKPSSNDPPPPGEIHFTYDGAQWSMDGNGDNKTPVASGTITATSSHLLYGTGYRWSLAVEPAADGSQYDQVVKTTTNGQGEEVVQVIVENWVHQDVVAKRPRGDGTFDTIRLTDLFGYVNATFHPNYGSQFARWSNDQGDTFFSFKGIDVSNAISIDPDGKFIVEQPDTKNVIVRVWISGSDMHAFADVWTPVTWNSVDGDGNPIVEVVVSSSSLYEGNFKHDWSPDGDKIVYVLDPTPSVSGINEDVWVKSVSDGTVTRVFDANIHVNDPSWQPFGSKIAFWFGGNIYTVQPDGTGLQTVIESTAHAIWSPDGQYMVFRNARRRGFDKYFYELDRFELSTSKTIRLTDDLDTSLNKTLLGWFAEQMAEP